MHPTGIQQAHSGVKVNASKRVGSLAPLLLLLVKRGQLFSDCRNLLLVAHRTWLHLVKRTASHSGKAATMTQRSRS
jgi:hypothetical protein